MMWDDSHDDRHSLASGGATRPVNYVAWDEPRDPAWLIGILVLIAMAIVLLALVG